ncbi:MAG: hypothetical protein JNL14_14310 [Devosia sp.]|uniref:hypothetical protein n=1 Tax=Devosia sp. TaxID=1871048 RepID=UPI001A36395A|nr:hypothetical protein [Devosia sp.]MBL8598904.1 hypothetical protein [Devosia sp.]
MELAKDERALELALRAWKIPACLLVPIAAVNKVAIATYIGGIEIEQRNRAGLNALLVRIPSPPPRDERLRIWDLPCAPEFFSPLQVWVDIEHNGYRAAYRKLLPDRDIVGLILSHAMNRRTALSKGYQFVRLTPVSRANNTSSGFSEGWAVARYHADAREQEGKRQGACIQYADLADLMLMADQRLGFGVMELVNEGQRLVDPERP